MASRGGRSSGNLIGRQYFVIKRGQPVMAATKHEKTAGAVVDNDDEGPAGVEDRTYADSAKMADGGRFAASAGRMLGCRSGFEEAVVGAMSSGS